MLSHYNINTSSKLIPNTIRYRARSRTKLRHLPWFFTILITFTIALPINTYPNGKRSYTHPEEDSQFSKIYYPENLLIDKVMSHIPLSMVQEAAELKPAPLTSITLKLVKEFKLELKKNRIQIASNFDRVVADRILAICYERLEIEAEKSLAHHQL